MWSQLLLTGLLITVLPLTAVWRSKTQSKYRQLIVVTLFLTFDLIVFGAFTRLTDSGLGCPDWPGCYGQANPLASHAAITEAQNLMPTGPVTMSKAWIEMIHRYLAMTVGILIMVQMSMAWLQRTKMLHGPKLPTAIFLLVCLQGAFGAWTVTLKLQPVIVTIHLLLGMSLLAILSCAWIREEPLPVALATPVTSQYRPAVWFKALAALGLLLVVMQVALGGWVSTNYATLACVDFPLCNGKLIPELDFTHGFTLWRDLGRQANGDYLEFSALVAIQWVHRSFAWLVLITLCATAWQALKSPEYRLTGKRLLIVLGLQFLTGIATVYFSWPLFIAVLHNAGAAMLVLLLSMLNYRLHRGYNLNPVVS